MSTLVSRALDMDEWKHSWRNKLKTSKDFKSAIKVLQDKIDNRYADIDKLKIAVAVAKKEYSEKLYYEKLEEEEEEDNKLEANK